MSKTYKFPQFGASITDPQIIIDMTNIRHNAITKLASVFVTLSVDGSEFSVEAIDMPYTEPWDDANLPRMVDLWLDNYLVSNK